MNTKNPNILKTYNGTEVTVYDNIDVVWIIPHGNDYDAIRVDLRINTVTVSPKQYVIGHWEGEPGVEDFIPKMPKIQEVEETDPL